MSKNTFDPNTQIETLIKQSQELNNVLVEHIGKLSDFQGSTLRAYGELMLEQLRSAQSVQDPKSLQSFIESQAGVFKTVSSRLQKDLTGLVELNSRFAEEVQKSATNNVTLLQPKTAAKKAARKSA